MYLKSSLKIQQGLPRTSYYKMIDIFLIVKLNSLVITMGFHTYVAYIVTQAKNEPLNLLGSSKLVKKISPMTESEDEQKLASKIKYAKRLNTISKIVFPLFMIIFNVFFFIVAFIEYFRPADQYITHENEAI